MTYVVESIDTPDGSFTAVAREDGTVVASGWTRSTAGARRLGLPDTKPALVDWAGAAAPWRSYATTHLWGPLTPPASFSESVQS